MKNANATAAAAAKTPAKKAAKTAKPVPVSGPKTAFNRTAKITLTPEFKNCPSLKGEGVSAQRVKVLRKCNGKTVLQYLEALRTNELPSGLGNLIACVKQGYAQVA